MDKRAQYGLPSCVPPITLPHLLPDSVMHLVYPINLSRRRTYELHNWAAEWKTSVLMSFKSPFSTAWGTPTTGPNSPVLTESYLPHCCNVREMNLTALFRLRLEFSHQTALYAKTPLAWNMVLISVLISSIALVKAFCPTRRISFSFCVSVLVEDHKYGLPLPQPSP